jgi:alkylation response protein AidB-like acyl-CoA dehydrogenase
MANDGVDRELWANFCTELGLSGVGIDEALGGAGLGMVEFAIIAEAAGAQVAAVPLLGLPWPRAPLQQAEAMHKRRSGCLQADFRRSHCNLRRHALARF